MENILSIKGVEVLTKEDLISVNESKGFADDIGFAIGFAYELMTDWNDWEEWALNL